MMLVKSFLALLMTWQFLQRLLRRYFDTVYKEKPEVCLLKQWPCQHICRVLHGCILLQGLLYRCRKCRRLLATQSNVVPVTEGPGSIAFKYRFVSIIHVPTSCTHGQTCTYMLDASRRARAATSTSQYALQGCLRC